MKNACVNCQREHPEAELIECVQCGLKHCTLCVEIKPGQLLETVKCWKCSGVPGAYAHARIGGPTQPLNRAHP